MSFRDDLTEDLNANFFNVEEFGETITLRRGNAEASIQCLYDSPVISDASVGTDVNTVEHFPRLFVRSVDLPDGKPQRDDRFDLASTEFHSAISLIAMDFVFEKDGTVMYRCKQVEVKTNA
jgi:hypothetical protein